MRRLAGYKKAVDQWRGLERKLRDISESLPLAAEDVAFRGEIESEVEALANTLNQVELELSLSGEFDNRNAILSIHAGAGGTESQDWAQMLMRMYLRWAERRGFNTEILTTSPGDIAGIKSADIEITGDYAFGYAKSEHGVHRLVRLSPFDADHNRHTSFVLIEVMPEAEDDIDIKIKPEDLKVDAFRSSGAGGQNVQKVSSAVRITHLPSGLVVTCQSERSQHQNREIAMRLLEARLLKQEIARQAEERAKIKGERIEAGWGSQIRSYVLHPYKMVKDHRTDFQSGNPEAVLDGELDDFITAYLRSRIGQETI